MNRHLNRRDFMRLSSGFLAAGSALPLAGATSVRAAVPGAPKRIAATAAKARLHPELPIVDLWSFGGTVPGPLIRVKQGAEVFVRLTNELSQGTSIHWHGIRVPNAMDGVPFLTQDPVANGKSFDYRFRADDAGTFFYHPHINSVEQVGRGMFGPLVVEETQPIPVDREVLWALNDWRFGRDRKLDQVFNDMHDLSHAGRYGNVFTINGKPGVKLTGRPRERVRLRLIGAATGRVFALDFGTIEPWLVALDGQPVPPRLARPGDLVLGPGMRVDLVIDLPASPGAKAAIVDRYTSDRPFQLTEIVVENGKPARARSLGKPQALKPNPIRPFEANGAERLEVVFGGGAMGGMMGMSRGSMMRMAQRGLIWIINGKIIEPVELGKRSPPLFQLRRNRNYIVAMENRTAFDHPIHLHGHTFQMLTRNGRKLDGGVLRDTAFLRPRDKVEIGFAADNPGQWMFHCHILSHQKAAMGAVLEVA